MKQGSAVATKMVEQAAAPALVSMEELLDRVNAFYESTARRAFEIFRDRGGADGNDLEDWLHAEAELFHGAHLNVTESDDALAACAEVPGFDANELEVSVEPRRLTITGRRRIRSDPTPRRMLYGEQCPSQIFRTVGLPVEVDPEKATAALRDGILELLMPKAAQPVRVPVDVKTDWMVRAEDYRAWKESFDAPAAAAPWA